MSNARVGSRRPQKDHPGAGDRLFLDRPGRLQGRAGTGAASLGLSVVSSSFPLGIGCHRGQSNASLMERQQHGAAAGNAGLDEPDLTPLALFTADGAGAGWPVHGAPERLSQPEPCQELGDPPSSLVPGSHLWSTRLSPAGSQAFGGGRRLKSGRLRYYE